MRTFAPHLVIASLAVAGLTLGCSSSDSGLDASTAGQDAGPVCYSVALSTVDGTSACSSTTCSAGQYCFDAVGICNTGCTVTSNCARGWYCDLSNGQTDQKGVAYGTCRQPDSSLVVTCSAPGPDAGSFSCTDVHGVYTVSLDTTASTAACSQGLPGTSQCTVTQSGSTLTWSCSPATDAFTQNTLGANCTCAWTDTGGSCTMQFVSGGFNWECDSTSGPAVICKGTGTKQ